MSIFVPYNQAIRFNYESAKEQVVKRLTLQQKKVIAVVLTIFAAFAIVYTMRKSFFSQSLPHSQKNYPLSDAQLANFTEVLNQKGIWTWANQDVQFKALLNDPGTLTYFLTQFSSDIYVKVRFELALLCGKKLKSLDLSRYPDFDDQKLVQLIRACPNLEILNLSWTSITKLNLPLGLKELHLNHCGDLSAQELEKLSVYSNLEKLSVSKCKIANLGKLPQSLKELSLAQCHYYHFSPQEWAKLTSLPLLEKLDLSLNPFLTTLKQLPTSLKELNLNYCQNIPAQAFDYLATLTHLKRLQVENTQIAALDKLPKNLKELNLNDCTNLQPQQFNSLRHFLNLENLYLERTKIDSLNTFSSSLKKLNINQCQDIPQQEFNHLGSLPHLECLNVRGTKIERLNILPKGLKQLVLGYCPNISSQQFSFLRSFSKLEILDLQQTCIEELDILPRSLKELYVNDCSNLLPKKFDCLSSFSLLETFGAAQTLITRLDLLPKSLKNLDLNNCKNLLPKNFAHLSSLLKLEQLNVGGTEIICLNLPAKKLKMIDLSRCQNLTFQEIKKLAFFPRLQNLFLNFYLSKLKDELKNKHQANFYDSHLIIW